MSWAVFASFSLKPVMFRFIFNESLYNPSFTLINVRAYLSVYRISSLTPGLNASDTATNMQTPDTDTCMC